MKTPRNLPQIYIEEFTSPGGAAAQCSGCKTEAKAGRKMCAGHLRLARERFASWVMGRQRQGLCILCQKMGQKIVGRDTKRLRRGIRCAFHRGVNAERCRRWMKENGQQVYQERLAAGVCAVSASHGPPVPGHTRCFACRKRDQAWRDAVRENRA